MLVVCSAPAVFARDAITPATSLDQALSRDATGEEIYGAACAACHGADGAGSPRSVVGFARPLPNGHDIPDFRDCATSTVEPTADWMAVVHEGGPVRALDRRMPAFGDALSVDQIDRVLNYVRTFCADSSWPIGDLNLPRPFFTEKAYPENETVWTAAVTTSPAGAFRNQLVYERRFGSRSQYEVRLPIAVQRRGVREGWSRGIGDVEIAVKHVVHANLDRGSIFSAGAGIVLPTGKETEGLGTGDWVYEPFAMWGQLLGANGFVQAHTGLEISSDHDRGTRETFLRVALGYTVAQDRGFGRAWSPMVEVLVAKPRDARAEWDLVPQVQVSLSKLQHVLLNIGVRVPLTDRVERKPQVLTYLLWDWFDGGLFGFWR